MSARPRCQEGTRSAQTGEAPRIVRLFDLPEGVEPLRFEAGQEGFRFLDKLTREWREGTNRFSQPGEVLFGAYRGTDLVAVGGLNRDPFADYAGAGRLRHLYVSGSARRSGIGTALVRRLIRHAESGFSSIRLRTTTRQAARFYVGLGFQPVQDETATHALLLPPS